MIIRLKKLRTEYLKLSQEELAKKIGLKKSAISDIERGKNSLKENNLKLICQTFNVNEEWLRNGVEPIFKEGSKEDDVLKTLKNTYQLNDTDLKFLDNFFSLSSDQRQMLYKLFDLKE